MEFSNWQHGFYPGRSTVTNLLTLIQYPSLVENFQIDVVYTDLTKAFDKVDFSILVGRMIDIGLPAWMTRVIYSYLCDRKNYVAIDDTLSTPFVPTSGVPQGSNLGPLLFNIYVNKLDDNINTKFLMYADDAKIY